MVILINLNDARKKLNELEGSAEYNKGVTDAFNALFDLPTVKAEPYKEESKDGLIISKNLCDSCINYGCIFQYGIVRNHCDFYKAGSVDMGVCKKYMKDLTE